MASSTSMTPRMRPTSRDILVIAGLAVAYFLAARLLISLSTSPSGPVTTVWLPSGIAVGALVLAGPWAALGSFLGSLAVALQMDTPVPLAMAVSAGNTGGELLCYALLTRWGRRSFGVEQVRDAPRLALAAAASGAVSATVSVIGYVHYGFIPGDAFLANFLAWMGSGLSSIVVVTPLVVYAVRLRQNALPSARRMTEFGSALLLLAMASFLWQGPHFQRGVDEPVILLLILGQIWIAFRFAPAAATLSNCVVAACAVTALVLRVGHAEPASAYPFILSLQIMLTGLALVGYLLAAMVQGQRRAAAALRDAQGALVKGARDAGRAEIATNVLHNVGNVLNSVNVSAQLVAARLQASRVSGLSRAVEMIDAHRHDLGPYLTQDEKGRLLPGYLGQVARALEKERDGLAAELQLLVRNIGHIKDVVATQQGYAGVSTVLERVQLRELVEDALRLDQSALARAGVTVIRDFQDVPVAAIDKTRVVQILVNLISNARHAMAGRQGPRRLTLRVGQEDDGLFASVADEGEGIPRENLTRIFSHGFTTREGGHGFGLHSTVLGGGEKGGTPPPFPDGAGKGGTIKAKLPAHAVLEATA